MDSECMLGTTWKRSLVTRYAEISPPGSLLWRVFYQIRGWIKGWPSLLGCIIISYCSFIHSSPSTPGAATYFPHSFRDIPVITSKVFRPVIATLFWWNHSSLSRFIPGRSRNLVPYLKSFASYGNLQRPPQGPQSLSVIRPYPLIFSSEYKHDAHFRAFTARQGLVQLPFPSSIMILCLSSLFDAISWQPSRYSAPCSGQCTGPQGKVYNGHEGRSMEESQIDSFEPFSHTTVSTFIYTPIATTNII